MNAGDQPPDVDDLARSMMELLGVHEQDEPHVDDDIAPDDGVFDVAVLDAASYASALRLAWRIFQRRPDADAGITFYRGRTVRVSCEPIMPVEADGELLGATPMAVELIPLALTVLAPQPRRLSGDPDAR